MRLPPQHRTRSPHPEAQEMFYVRMTLQATGLVATRTTRGGICIAGRSVSPGPRRTGCRGSFGGLDCATRAKVAAIATPFHPARTAVTPNHFNEPDSTFRRNERWIDSATPAVTEFLMPEIGGQPDRYGQSATDYLIKNLIEEKKAVHLSRHERRGTGHDDRQRRR